MHTNFDLSDTESFNVYSLKFPWFTGNPLVSHTTPQLQKQMCYQVWCIIPLNEAWILPSSLHLNICSLTPENARIACWDFKVLKSVCRSSLGLCFHNNINGVLPHLFRQCHTQYGFQRILALSGDSFSLACPLYFSILSQACLRQLTVTGEAYLIFGPRFAYAITWKPLPSPVFFCSF